MDLNGNEVPGASPCKSSLEILHCTDQAQRHDFKHSSDLAELEAKDQNRTSKDKEDKEDKAKTCQDQLNQLYHNTIQLSYHIYAYQ